MHMHSGMHEGGISSVESTTTNQAVRAHSATHDPGCMHTHGVPYTHPAQEPQEAAAASTEEEQHQHFDHARKAHYNMREAMLRVRSGQGAYVGSGWPQPV